MYFYLWILIDIVFGFLTGTLIIWPIQLLIFVIIAYKDYQFVQMEDGSTTMSLIATFFYNIIAFFAIRVALFFDFCNQEYLDKESKHYVLQGFFILSMMIGNIVIGINYFVK